MAASFAGLRIALVTGTLGQGGAEKQLVYLVRALLENGAALRVYSLTTGEFHEPALYTLGIKPVWFGRWRNPVARAINLGRMLAAFKPHLVQSAHSYTNLYTALAARHAGSLSVGALRSGLTFTAAKETGIWTRWSMCKPDFLLANSRKALEEVREAGWIRDRQVHYLPNVIDLEENDRVASFPHNSLPTADGEIRVIFVGRLIAVKKLERFVLALSRARRHAPALQGIIVGDGPERKKIQKLAAELMLGQEVLTFLGRRDDTPALLQRAQIFMMCSDHEGFPNVILEAMAARLPVIATPAGDCEYLVQEGRTGFLADFEDIETMAARLVQLARSADLRRRLGEAAHEYVRHNHNYSSLAVLLHDFYEKTAQNSRPGRFAQLPLSTKEQLPVVNTPEESTS